MTFEKTAAIIAEYRDIDPSEIKMETTFEELGFDSLDTVELAMKLEEEFNVTITVNAGMKTVGDVVREIEASIQ